MDHVYEDRLLSPEQRAADLTARLSLEEKVGLMFNTVITVGAPGDHDAPGRFGEGSVRSLIADRLISHFSLSQLPEPSETVQWHNEVQRLALRNPHSIPVTFGSDPRHGFSTAQGMALSAGHLSQWPEPLGIAAIGDASLFERFGDIVRQEYRALGISVAIHPQLDLATDPRWSRQLQCFGQDPRRVSEYACAFIRGMQGGAVGPQSVACMPKHFPGGGPQKDGEDPHFPYGREQIYPGGRFDDHLEPFRAALECNVEYMMPYYGMPVGLSVDGTPVDEVGFSFNRFIVTDLLRDTLGFDGTVVSDFAILTDIEVGGLRWPAKAWGVEHLDRSQRAQLAIEAGVDQFGGEADTELILGLVRSNRVSVARIDESVQRILRTKFSLGLFDERFIDPDETTRIVANPDFVAEGREAQSRSITVLKNKGLLPLPTGVALFLDGLDDATAAEYGASVAVEPADADVAILRLGAAFEPRDTYFLESTAHQGSLDYPDEVIDLVRESSCLTAVLLDIHLDRAAILTPLEPFASAIVVDYGASIPALLDALFGRVAPIGTLPIELPRSMAAVRASRPDVASDTVDPLYPVGSGLLIDAGTSPVARR